MDIGGLAIHCYSGVRLLGRTESGCYFVKVGRLKVPESTIEH